MIFTLPKKQKRNAFELLGAVQISGAGFFVYKDEKGQIKLQSGEEEKIQKSAVEKMMDLNPKIKRLLERYKIKPSVDTRTLKDLADGHMNETCKVATGILNLLTEALKEGVNKESIKEASMLHDLGKVLIPSKILNKPARLNKKERKIMNIHSTLGYELLKTQNISEETLDLVKYHHQNLKHTGYPLFKASEHPSDIAVQIISIADKYSALREARVYRRKLSRIESLLILYKEVLEGKIHKEVYKALLSYAANFDS